tara:strand:- start:277 stop:1038 length:762 start_codon:yes stop_codon:yes gene_type:complete
MLDSVVVSSDEYFKGFFPIVAKAWRKFFPEVEVCAAFVTARDETDDEVCKLRGIYDRVSLYPPVKGIPDKNVAKMSRFLLASSMGKKICSIEDVDTIPLQRDYFANKISLRENNKILAVGKEVYRGTDHNSSFPVSTATAEGDTFKKIFNPNDLEYFELYEFWKNFTCNEGRKITDENFSDEGLIVKLVEHSSFENIQHVERGVDIINDWVDRSSWDVDKEKLERGGYVTCNFLRPFEDNEENFGDIIDYING